METRDAASTRSTDRRLKALAWGIFGYCLAVAVFGLIAIAQFGPGVPSDRTGVDAVTTTVFELVVPSVGLLIVAHRPRNVIGWLLLVVAVLQSTGSLLGFYATLGLYSEAATLPFAAAISVVDPAVGIPSVALLPVLLLVYPTGRFLSPRSRWLAGACVGMGLTVAIVIAVGGWPYRGRTFFLAPESVSGLRPLLVAITAYFVLILVAGSMALVSLVLRYRRSNREERLQIKWLAVAAAIAIVDLALDFIFPIEATWRSVLSNVAVALIPLAIGIAVLRYRLYEIEVIINRTLVYIPLIAIIGGLATALIPLSQRIFMAVTGNTSDAAIVLTTLFVASFVTPIRKRLEGAVEGRFRAGPTASDPVPAANGPVDVGDRQNVAAELRALADRVEALERSSRGRRS